MYIKKTEILLYWNRQIKEFLNESILDSRSSSRVGTLFDEIEFCEKNLTNVELLIEQVRSPEIQRIIQILKSSNSPNLNTFLETVDRLSVIFVITWFQ